MKRREVRMRVKQILACVLVASSLIGAAAASCDYVDDWYHSQTFRDTTPNMSPDDWEYDSVNLPTECETYSVDEMLAMYNEGFINIHYLAQAYVFDPVKFASLESYAKQSEHYNYYVEHIVRKSQSVEMGDASDSVSTESLAANTSTSDEEKNTNNDGAASDTASDDVNGDKETIEAIESNTETASASQNAVGEKWEETESYEPTCTEVGGTVYMNSVTHELKTDEVPALGHDEGKWVTTVEPTFFKSGKAELRCTRDQFVLDTKTLPQIIPIWSIVLVAVAILGIVFVLIKKVTKKTAIAKPKLKIVK